jgi:hypothetical protein
MKDTLKFNATKAEVGLILLIARRASAMAKAAGFEYNPLDATMDLEACHCNGCPLDLPKLADFDDGNFGHDVFGIRRFINRERGKLTNCFLPRSSAHA